LFSGKLLFEKEEKTPREDGWVPRKSKDSVPLAVPRVLKCLRSKTGDFTIFIPRAVLAFSREDVTPPPLLLLYLRFADSSFPVEPLGDDKKETCLKAPLGKMAISLPFIPDLWCPPFYSKSF
jgi:hypothetical protein